MGRLSPAGVKQTESLPEMADHSADRCDAACPAQAQVRLIRYPDGELAFCSHHFRQHALALQADGWQQTGLGTADAGERDAAGATTPP